METKANYTLVGGFVLLFVFIMIAFVVWIARIGFDRNYAAYDIYFTRTVTGLKEGSSVLYRGVPVGVVEAVALDPTNIERVRVSVRLDGTLKIKQDAFASIELQGITGTSYIQLNGGTQESSILKPTSGSYHAVIPSRSSVLEEVTDSLPAVLTQVSRTFEEIRELFTTENREAFTQTMQNLKEITDALNPSSQENKNGKVGLLADIRDSVHSIRTMTEQLQLILSENRQSINSFTLSGLPAFTRFLKDGSQSFTSLKRVLESLERSPGRFLYNDPKEGVRVK